MQERIFTSSLSTPQTSGLVPTRKIAETFAIENVYVLSAKHQIMIMSYHQTHVRPNKMLGHMWASKQHLELLHHYKQTHTKESPSKSRMPTLWSSNKILLQRDFQHMRFKAKWEILPMTISWTLGTKVQSTKKREPMTW